MEIFFLLLLIVLMAGALASGFPVAFSLPGSAILTIGLAAGAGFLFEGDASAYFHQGGASNWLSAGVTNFRGIYWEVERDTLIAIPLFVFMGIMLQRSKIAEDLLITMAQLFGPVRGGLGISVVFVGALLAATTGILGATVVAMGMISLPAMLRNNYQNWLSTGTIMASGTLGQIIPPSIVLIILADQLSNAVDQAGAARAAAYKAATGEFSMPSEFGVTSTSAGDMFMGAMLPGLVLVAVYMLFILLVAFIKRDVAPPVPFEGKFDRTFLGKVIIALIPPLALIFIVLGSIITGVATVNQAGSIGAIGAMVMAGYRLYEGHKRAFYPVILAGVSILVILALTSLYTINIKSIDTNQEVIVLTLALIAVGVFLVGVVWSGARTMRVNNTMQGVLMETAKTTSLVFIILLGAAMLTSAFRAFGGEDLVKEFLSGLPGGFWAQFIIVMLVIFLLGFFLDFIEIAVVVVPIVAPILLADETANVSAVWLGVMIGLNIQTSFLTPPFGFALFYLRGVAPSVVKTIHMYKGVIPFIILQLLALLIVGLNPQLVNYLPTRSSLLSETAPPPSNPRLQACIQDFVAEQFDEKGDEIRAGIAAARSWDISSLPEDMQTDVTRALDNAEASFTALQDAKDASADIDEAAIVYRPLQVEARTIQRDIAAHVKGLEDDRRELSSLKRNAPDEVDQIADLEEHILQLEAEKVELEERFPDEWPETQKEFTKFLTAEKRAVGLYRRTLDNAYEPIGILKRTLEGTSALEELRPEIAALADSIRNEDPATVEALYTEMELRVGNIENAGDLRTALSEVRRVMRSTGNTVPDPDQAVELHAAAMEILDSEIAWRSTASQTLLSDVQAYEELIRDTIGLRQQPRIPRNVALHVASCRSNHEDISLYF